MLRQLDVIRYRVRAELRAEMDRAYFGLIWWIAEPILYMAVFYVVFSLLFKQRGGGDFVPFLLCGLIAWRWFDASVRNGANSIMTNAGLMNQVYLPKLVFPMITVAANSVKFFIILGLLLLFLLIYGVEPGTTWLALPALILIQGILILVCASLLALVVPFFPDLNILISNAMTLMLFLSGVFFSVQDLPVEAQTWFYLNPMAVVVESYRLVLIDHQWPEWHRLGAVLAASAAVGLLVYRLANRFDRVYPKIVG